MVETIARVRSPKRDGEGVWAREDVTNDPQILVSAASDERVPLVEAVGVEMIAIGVIHLVEGECGGRVSAKIGVGSSHLGGF